MLSNFAELIYYDVAGNPGRKTLHESLSDATHTFVFPVELSILILDQMHKLTSAEWAKKLFLNGTTLYSLDFASGACVGLASVLRKTGISPPDVHFYSGFKNALFETGYSLDNPYVRLERANDNSIPEWKNLKLESLPVWLRKIEGPTFAARRERYTQFWLNYLNAEQKQNVPLTTLTQDPDSLAHGFHALWAVLLVSANEEAIAIYDGLVDAAIDLIERDKGKPEQILQDAAAGATALIMDLARDHHLSISSFQTLSAIESVGSSFTRLLLRAAGGPTGARLETLSLSSIALLEYALTLAASVHGSADQSLIGLRSYLTNSGARLYRGKGSVPSYINSSEDLICGLCGLLQATNPLFWFESKRAREVFENSGVVLPTSQAVSLKKIFQEVQERAKILWRKKELSAPMLNRLISPFIALTEIKPKQPQESCAELAGSLKKALQAEYLSRLILSNLEKDDFRYALQYLPTLDLARDIATEETGSRKIDRFLFVLFLRMRSNNLVTKVPADLHEVFLNFILSWQRSVGLNAFISEAPMDGASSTPKLENLRDWRAWIHSQNPEQMLKLVLDIELEQLSKRPEELQIAASNLIEEIKALAGRARELEYRPFDWKIDGVPVGWIPIRPLHDWERIARNVRNNLLKEEFDLSSATGSLDNIIQHMDALRKSARTVHLVYRTSSIAGINTIRDFLGTEVERRIEIDPECLSDIDFRRMEDSTHAAAWTPVIFPEEVSKPHRPPGFLGLKTGDTPLIPFGLGRTQTSTAPISEDSLIFQFSDDAVFSRRSVSGAHCLIVFGVQSLDDQGNARTVTISDDKINDLKAKFGKTIIWKPTADGTEFLRNSGTSEGIRGKEKLKRAILEDLKNAHTFIYFGHGTVSGRVELSGLEIFPGTDEERLLNIMEISSALRSTAPGVVLLGCCHGASVGNPADISAIRSSHLSRVFLASGSSFVMAAPFPIGRGSAEAFYFPEVLAGVSDKNIDLAAALKARTSPKTRRIMQFFGNPFLKFENSKWNFSGEASLPLGCLAVSLSA